MPSKTILDCCPELQRAWPKILKFVALKHKGHRLQIIETHVPPEEQKERWNIGRNGRGEELQFGPGIITHFDGTKEVSLHNYYPARALRFRIMGPDGHECWPTNVFVSVEQMAETQDVNYTLPDLIWHRPALLK